tara:strand:- start:331 stop:735 length:405 start_codon:yes stop_codon:yes gene_type:complete
MINDITKIKIGTTINLRDSGMKFIVTSIEWSAFIGTLLNSRGEEISTQAEIFFSNFSNPHYKDGYSLDEVVDQDNVFMKANRVIDSCVTQSQLDTARTYVDLMLKSIEDKSWEIETKKILELKSQQLRFKYGIL